MVSFVSAVTCILCVHLYVFCASRVRANEEKDNLHVLHYTCDPINDEMVLSTGSPVPLEPDVIPSMNGFTGSDRFKLRYRGCLFCRCLSFVELTWIQYIPIIQLTVL